MISARRTCDQIDGVLYTPHPQNFRIFGRKRLDGTYMYGMLAVQYSKENCGSSRYGAVIGLNTEITTYDEMSFDQLSARKSSSCPPYGPPHAMGSRSSAKAIDTCPATYHIII